MKNHDEKIKDIAESLLPSTRRGDAHKDRQTIHRHNRRRISQHLGRLEEDYLPEEKLDLLDDDHGKVREFMWDRRNADKLGAFLRWAEATTAHLDDEGDKYDLIKRLMPDTLIGRHALTHLPFKRENPFAYSTLAYRYEYDPETGKHVKVYKPAKVWDAATIEAALRQRIDRPGFHSKLNRTIKDAFTPVKTHSGYDRATRTHVDRPCTCRSNLRLLMGLHDIEAFAAHYARPHRWTRFNSAHYEVTEAIFAFLA